jgi:L-ribulose-5-phosphate 3-epimerase
MLSGESMDGRVFSAMNRIKLGVRLESFGLPFRRALAEAAKFGVPGVQLDAMGDLAPGQLSQTGRRELCHLLRSHNLELTALGCPLRRGLSEARDLQQRLEHVRQVMTLSYDLGPRIVIAEVGPVPESVEPTKTAGDERKSVSGSLLSNTLFAGTPDLSGGVKRGASPASVPERGKDQVMAEALANLGAHGDRTGTMLALETGLEAGSTLNSYLQRFDSGALRVNLDPANLLMHGFSPVDSMRALKDRIVHGHAHDARHTKASRSVQEVPLGHGDIDWMLFLAVLEEIEYTGYFVVEQETGDNRPADVRHGVEFLRRVVGI